MADFAVTGAIGQMGSTVIEELKESQHRIHAFDRGETEVNGIEVTEDENLHKFLEREDIDAVIDFTVPEATMRYLDAAVETGTPLVIGTTGFTEEEFKRIEQVGEQIPVLKASNFSKSINIMKKLVAEVAESLEDYDIEVSETHHNRKRDAPSGTAGDLLEAIRESRSFEEVHGREGEAPRTENEIGVHAKRAGDIRGVHEVLFAGDDEVFKLRHRSESRAVFAAGAIEAAEWLQNQEEGFYSFEEVIKHE